MPTLRLRQVPATGPASPSDTAIYLRNIYSTIQEIGTRLETLEEQAEQLNTDLATLTERVAALEGE